MARSSRRLGKHIRDTVGEHARDLPIQAARLTVFGIGRALVLSDRLARDYKELRGSGPRPVLHRMREDARHLVGNIVVRVTERVSGSPEPASAKPGPTEPESAVNRPAPHPDGRRRTAPQPQTTPADKKAGKNAAAAEAAGPVTRPDPKPKAAPKSKIAPESLPVPNYDQATLPALRGRLRGLSVDQVILLRAYERENAARPDVLRMYENRIAKLKIQATAPE